VSVRLVIFDCDGVLFHSERANLAFYNAVLHQVGEPPLAGDAEIAAHALASTDLYQKYFGDRPEVLARVREASRTLDYGPFYPLMQPHERLREILTALRTSYRTAMATNRGKTTGGVLRHFSLHDLFDLAVGALDVDRPKPHPDMLLRCLEHFGVDGDQAVYVGDQAIDAASARAAGLRFIGIGPAAVDARYGIEHLDDLEALLASF